VIERVTTVISCNLIPENKVTTAMFLAAKNFFSAKAVCCGALIVNQPVMIPPLLHTFLADLLSQTLPNFLVVMLVNS
jgi:hypothetical protein